MNRGPLWITTAVFGAAGFLIVGVGGLVGIVFLMLAPPLVVHGARLVALAGLLTGFGACWLFMMERQSSSGGRLDSSSLWLTVGIVPLAIGLVLAVAVVSRHLRVRLAGRG